MDHPYGKQYGQEGNPRAYMTMRDYRNLPYQWGNQQPVGRNPTPPRSIREYRDQWMSAPVYSVPSTYPPPPQYDYPEPPFYASTPQSPQSPQPPQLISPLEQAILDLTKLVSDAVVEQKEFKAQLSKKFHTEENSLDQKLDGLKDDFEHKWDSLHDFSEDLIDQQQCPPEEECQRDTRVEEQRVVTVQANQETETVESSLNNESDGFQSKIDQNLDILQESISKLTQQPDQEDEEKLEEESQEDECLTEPILGEQVQLQPQEELKVELVKAPPEELQDTPQSGDTFWPRKQEEQTSALISEEESQEEECLNGTIVEESCLQQPQQGLVENSESLEIGVVVCLWEKEDAIPLCFTEKSSGHEGTQENIIQPSPIGLDTIATAQDTKNPLPLAPSDDQVYILPTPSENPKPATPAPKARSNPSLHAMKNLKILVAFVHSFAITSKKMATAYIAWHSGWFGCGFGFGAPGPRHF